MAAPDGVILLQEAQLLLAAQQRQHESMDARTAVRHGPGRERCRRGCATVHHHGK